jgi:hypothetical protein
MSVRYRPASARPINKVTGGALAGALATLLTWLVREFGGVDIPGEVQAAVAVIIGYAVSYLIPLAPGEIVIDNGQ